MHLLKKGFYVALFTLFANLFLFHPLGPVAFVLFSIGFCIFLIAIASESAFFARYQKILLYGGIFLFALSYSILTRANPTVFALNQLGVVSFLTLFLYLMTMRLPFVRSLFEFCLVPVSTVLYYINAGITAFFHVFSLRSILPRLTLKIPFTQIMVGLLIGLPIVGVLIVLFANGDPIFASTLNKLFHFSFTLPSIPVRLVYSLVVVSVTTPIVFMNAKEGESVVSPFTFRNKQVFIHEMSVVTGLVALTIAFFLVVEWRYVFVNVPFETDLSAFGVATYSEYVKRGFNELLIASVFIYAIIWSGLIILRNRIEERKTVLLYVQGIVIGEFFVFLVSLFRRVYLYQQYHGLTVGRMYGSFVLIGVLLMTGILLGRHFWKRNWVVIEVGTVAVLLVLFGFFNAEDFIARHDHPTVNKRVDYVYLSRMSADGYEGWRQSFDWASETLLQMSDKSSFDAHNRRDIAYAGMVVRQLMRNYDWVVHEYHSPEEIEKYYQAFISHEQTRIEQFSARNQEQFKTIPDEGKKMIENQVNQAVENNQRVDNLTFGRESEVIYGSLLLGRKALEHWREGPFEKKQRLILFPSFDFRPNPSDLCEVVDEARYLHLILNPHFSTNCIASFYQLPFYGLTFNYRSNQSRSAKIEISRLDQVLSWNQQVETTYMNMQKDITLEALFSLQDRYFDLRKKILKQPDTEQSFEIDISFQTPFLPEY